MKKQGFLSIIFLLLIIFTGCSNTSADSLDELDVNEDELEYVELKMYLLGDGAKDAPIIWEEINILLEEKINARIIPIFINWAEVNDKYPIIAASGESYDLIFSAAWKNYMDYARKGAFYELTDEMLEMYAPLTLERQESYLIDGARVPETGKLYQLPMNYTEYKTHCYVLRGDLMDKYGIDTIENSDDFIDYLRSISSEEGMIPFDAGGEFNQILSYPLTFESKTAHGITGATNNTVITYRLGTSQLLSDEEIRSLKLDMYKIAYEMRQAGLWSANAPTNKVSVNDSFKAGTSGATIENLANIQSLYTYISQTNPEWDMRVYPCTPEGTGSWTNPVFQNGISIGIHSQHPERALMALDILKNDRLINMTSVYGIEGDYWSETSEGKVLLTDDSDKLNGYPPDAACPWGWRDESYYLTIEGGLEDYDRLMDYFKDEYIANPLTNFVFNPEDVQEIHQALTSYKDERLKLLQWGLIPLDEIENTYDEIIAKQKAYGLDTYRDEIQRQIDAYMDSLN